jgi:ribosome-binding factor A
MVSKMRAQRIGERIREELSEMLVNMITDPRLQWVSVTDVRVDRELAYANIFVSALDGSERKDEIMDGFHSAQGFIRRQLAQRVDIRSFPQLRFHWDPTPENADRIEQLIASLHDEDAQSLEEETGEDG